MKVLSEVGAGTAREGEKAFQRGLGVGCSSHLYAVAALIFGHVEGPVGGADKLVQHDFGMGHHGGHADGHRDALLWIGLMGQG